MLFSYKELKEKYKSSKKIKKYLLEETILKIEKGIYSDTKNINYLEVIIKKHPTAIFKMDSAFYYYNLTDTVPEKEHLALKRDSTKINNEKIKVTYHNDNLFELGKTTMQVNGIIIPIYDKERLLIELIRNRNSIVVNNFFVIIKPYRISISN